MKVQNIQAELQAEKIAKHSRRVSFGDLVTDRWQNAKEYGWGEGSSCYDNVLVIGTVTVGRNTWVGPNVVLDGSAPGGLHIGENCTICAGVQIYTHDSVEWALTGGQVEYAKAPTTIGNHCFIGPNAVIAKGVTIGNRVAIGALSFVTHDIPDDAKAFGIPAKIRT
jgi:acetyltransferase-like isoleucine patch superfamily enzyme